ncbi:hypothetical protein C173_03249 [Paenibacillus sp. FSL R7-277]|uniref:hypothetical protein n=1 Tax=Paenibacillus sp. FSL R7-277 TaxID=1227352 RepID=UPI0003E2BFB3|nr:hypothetical protein [Paenibacillus sp. FSL R7-277]ETT77499.1 hypothetical protein C173_03249 [Paenibacillus sp. FSL R7-277]
MNIIIRRTLNLIILSNTKLLLGENAFMGPNARISWTQVTEQPVIPVLPAYIASTKITSTTIESPSIFGGTIAIGSGNNVFKADSEGIHLGNASFVNAPFRVSMDGKLTALDGTFTGTITGSTITGSTIKTATTSAGNLELSGSGFIARNTLGEKNGVVIDNGNFSSVDFYYRDQYRGGIAQTAGNLALTTTMGPIIIEAAQASSTMFRGKVDFTNATVTGIVAKFG